MWKFKQVSKGFWDDVNNQKECLDYAGEMLGVKSLDGWKGVTVEDVVKYRVRGLLDVKYGSSLSSALVSVYSSHSWQDTNLRRKAPSFNKKPKFWGSEAAVTLLKSIEKTLAIQHPSQWYRVSRGQIQSLGGGINAHYIRLLHKMYPTFQWQPELFQFQAKKSWQRLLLSRVMNLFEKLDVYEEYEILGPQGKSVQVDIYVPSLSLAFEYQGAQHYHDILSRFETAATQEMRDKKKLRRCRQLGVTIIFVPYWWRGDVESIAATITDARPDIRFSLPPCKPLVNTVRRQNSKMFV